MSQHDPESSPNIDEIESLAPAAAAFWLEEAERILDNQFGPGFAKKQPEILAGFLAACAQYFDAERRMDAAGLIAEAIEKARP